MKTLSREEIVQKVIELLSDAKTYDLVYIFNNLSQDCEGHMHLDEKTGRVFFFEEED